MRVADDVARWLGLIGEAPVVGAYAPLFLCISGEFREKKEMGCVAYRKSRGRWVNDAKGYSSKSSSLLEAK